MVCDFLFKCETVISRSPQRWDGCFFSLGISLRRAGCAFGSRRRVSEAGKRRVATMRTDGSRDNATGQVPVSDIACL